MNQEILDRLLEQANAWVLEAEQLQGARAPATRARAKALLNCGEAVCRICSKVESDGDEYEMEVSAATVETVSDGTPVFVGDDEPEDVDI